ncbi:MAG: nuclear transport factor 2 family protein [Chloroflexia bacterium]|nr:nuclear transport factor 2 family protein [Chloroflexia bacterium]
MTQDAKPFAAAWFDSWKARDFETFRTLLNDDVTVDGPMGHAGNADECLEGIQGMSRMVTDIVVHKIFANGSDVVTWFDLYTADAGPPPTTNWSHVENGKITRILVTFDPRPLLQDRGA